MPAFTVRYRPIPGTRLRTEVEDFARRSGATISWSDSEAYGCTYALLENVADGRVARDFSEGATVFETPVIALAIRPNAPEALPAIEHALGGLGRPAGIINVEVTNGAAIVEWNLDVTPALIVLDLVDVELARFRAGRVNELLTPLPLAWWTAIARDGLQAPEIAPDRVLEALIEERHVVS